MFNRLFKNKKILALGARGETAAKTYLKKCGYKIIAMNFSNTSGRRLGEIDIIAKDNDEFVFVEVKTRTATSDPLAPLPEESITPAKLYKLNKAASFYLAKKNIQNMPYRFDAITVLADSSNSCAKIKHIKNIFL